VPLHHALHHGQAETRATFPLNHLRDPGHVSLGMLNGSAFAL